MAEGTGTWADAPLQRLQHQGEPVPAAPVRAKKATGDRTHHGPPAFELVRALLDSALIQELLRAQGDGSRRPGTLATLERRWFVGRNRLVSAQGKHDSLSRADLTDELLGENLELVGTAGLLRLATSAGGSSLVEVRPSKHPNWHEFLLHVPVGKRGKLSSLKRTAASKASRQNGWAIGTKKYLVHDEVVSAAKLYIEAFEVRKGKVPTCLHQPATSEPHGDIARQPVLADAVDDDYSDLEVDAGDLSDDLSDPGTGFDEPDTESLVNESAVYLARPADLLDTTDMMTRSADQWFYRPMM